MPCSRSRFSPEANARCPSRARGEPRAPTLIERFMSCAEETRDLLVGREAFRRELREHELAVDRDLERAALRLDQIHLRVRKRALQLRGQTDRLREVVSLDAVLHRDLHRWFPRASADADLGPTCPEMQSRPEEDARRPGRDARRHSPGVCVGRREPDRGALRPFTPFRSASLK